MINRIIINLLYYHVKKNSKHDIRIILWQSDPNNLCILELQAVTKLKLFKLLNLTIITLFCYKALFLEDQYSFKMAHTRQLS